MRRLGRWIFHAASALSLLLCVATAVLWVRSYWAVDLVRWEPDSTAAAQATWEPGSLWPGPLNIEYRLACTTRGGLWIDWERYHWGWINDGILLPADRPLGDVLGLDGTRYPYCSSLIEPSERARLLGFEFARLDKRAGPDRFFVRSVTVPLPAVWLAALALPLAWLRRARLAHRQRHRAQHNLCLICGYDLRATPERCPECGTIPDAPLRVAANLEQTDPSQH